MRTATFFASLLAGLLLWSTDARAACVGDCNGGGRVEINELILGVNIALGMAEVSACPPFDANDSDTVTIQELIAAVNNALQGCRATPTPTATATATPSIELTATPTDVAPATATVTSATTATATTTLAPTATGTAAVSTATATANATETSTTAPTATIEVTPTVTPTQPAGDTSTPTATFTPTFTPTMGPTAVCGNGILEPGESCAGCAADCAVGQCSATATMTSFQMRFQGPPGTTPITATTLLGYRSNRISIPGSGNATSVRQRVVFPAPLPNTLAVNDLDYAVRVVVGRTAGLTAGLLYTVSFDTCQGAAPVMAQDFACTMEACAGAGGAISDCKCTVVAP